MPEHGILKLLYLTNFLDLYSTKKSNKDVLNYNAHELVESKHREFIDDNGISNSVDTELYFFPETGEYLEVTLYLTEFGKTESVQLYVPNK